MGQLILCAVCQTLIPSRAEVSFRSIISSKLTFAYVGEELGFTFHLVISFLFSKRAFLSSVELTPYLNVDCVYMYPSLDSFLFYSSICLYANTTLF